MKWVLHLLEKSRPAFERGGALGACRCVFNALENFFFAPASRTGRKPYVRDPLDVKRFMSMVIVALIPCLMAAYYFFGLRLLVMILVSYAAGGVVEVLFAMVRKEEINEGFLVTGMLFPLILPPTIPLWMIAMGVMFGVFAGKEVFGGTGRNVFNPAIVGRCFLALAYPVDMSCQWVKPGTGLTGRMLEFVTPASVDAVTQATPLGLAKRGDLVGLQDLFLGTTAGCIGETCALAILLGGLVLVLTRVASWRTVVSVVGSAAALAALLHWHDAQRFAGALWHVGAGGLLFGAFFMATDPVTSPVTRGGQWAYGVVIGTVTILIRNFTGYVEGMMFAILLGNTMAPIFDEVAAQVRLRRLQREG